MFDRKDPNRLFAGSWPPIMGPSRIPITPARIPSPITPAGIPIPARRTSRVVSATASISRSVRDRGRKFMTWLNFHWASHRAKHIILFVIASSLSLLQRRRFAFGGLIHRQCAEAGVIALFASGITLFAPGAWILREHQEREVSAFMHLASSWVPKPLFLLCWFLLQAKICCLLPVRHAPVKTIKFVL